MLKFALIGYPLSHSIGKKVYSDIFKMLKLNATYDHFEIKEDDLIKTIEYFRENEYKAFNVTIPYKNKVANLIEEVEEEAKEIGAVNNVLIENGKLHGSNTDIIGIRRSLETFKVKNVENACIIGAGGSARAALFAIKGIAKGVCIINRSIEKAFELQKIFNKHFSKVQVLSLGSSEAKSAIKNCDLLINCTPIGMYPNVNLSPLENIQIESNTTVIDLVYNPVQTKLISQAKSLGCKTIDGLWIYTYQLLANLKIWLNIELDANLVRNICESYLK